MKKSVIFSAIGWLGAALSQVAADDATQTGDIARLQGKWETLAGASRELKVAMEVVGTKVELTVVTPQGLKIQAKGSLQIDESTSPRSVDWVGFTAGALQKFPDIQGIYKVEGDSLVLCTGGFNDGRPSEFTPGEGPLADVLTFRRPGAPALADAARP